MNPALTVPPISTTEPVTGSLCTGIGGLDLAVAEVLGGRLAWVADPDRHISTFLTARALGVVNHGDITTVDWADVEPVDVLTAGFPCQDISANGKRAGIKEGTRSGLWYQVMAAVRVLRPGLVFVENVAALRWRGGGLHIVLGDLAAAGYDACWRSVRACDIGAAHRRERIFLLAWPHTATAGRDAASNAASQFRRRRPGPTDANDRAPTSPPRRHHPRSHAPGADADRGRLALRGDPNRAAPGPATTDRLRDADRRHAHAPSLARPQFSTGPGRLDDGGRAALDSSKSRRLTVPDSGPSVDWGDYTAAIHRWEDVTGRAAPHPTQPGRHGRPVLASRFVEWLMGYPDGWVTGLDLPRTAELHALGNAVVPAQAAQALTLLTADRHDLTDTSEGTATRPGGDLSGWSR